MLGQLTRGQLMDALRGLGVEKPEGVTTELSDDAIAGTVRKARKKVKTGQKFGPGLIVHWLREGGDEGFGEEAPPEPSWWQTVKGRAEWLKRNLPDLDIQYAETAIIGLTQQKREPSAALVREWTELVERQEREYDAACRALVAAQRKAALSGRVSESLGPSASSDAGSGPVGTEVSISLGVPASRPESAEEKREHSLPLGSPSD